MEVNSTANRLGFLLLLVSLCSCTPQNQNGPPGAQSGAPNIVLIYADDLGWRDIEPYSGYYRTPHLNRLAREGLRFTQAYANAPNCAPSRASLMTGQYTPRHGIYTVGSSERGQSKHRKLIPVANSTTLDGASVTIAERLRDAGYRTGMVGKWHLDNDPRRHGFDVALAAGHFGQPGSYHCPFRSQRIVIPDLSDNCEEGDYLTDRISQLAVDFIEDHDGQRPFFLYLPHYAVHTPIEAKPERVAEFAARPIDGGHNNLDYAAMVASLDDSVGRILATLERMKLTDNTLVVFFSDNGGHGDYTDMTPLKGAKGMLYEGGIRVPLIARWPGVVAANTRSDTPVIGTDLYTTFLELATGDIDSTQPLDGVSLLPLLNGEPEVFPADRPLYWHFPAYLQAYKGKGDGGNIWRTTPAGAIRMGRYKMIEWFESGEVELYDLEADIGESQNISTSMPDVTASLLAQMRSWRERVNAPVPVVVNPEYRP
ncbi:sulfatase [Porticoccus sp. GXU_MW_L64]